MKKRKERKRKRDAPDLVCISLLLRWGSPPTRLNSLVFSSCKSCGLDHHASFLLPHLFHIYMYHFHPSTNLPWYTLPACHSDQYSTPSMRRDETMKCLFLTPYFTFFLSFFSRSPCSMLGFPSFNCVKTILNYVYKSCDRLASWPTIFYRNASGRTKYQKKKYTRMYLIKNEGEKKNISDKILASFCFVHFLSKKRYWK